MEKKTNETRKKSPMVEGRVTFYGKTSNFNNTGKEWVLAIENPEFSNLDKEVIDHMYGLDKEQAKKKQKPQVADMYTKILDGEVLEVAYFRSQFDIEKVWLNGKLVDIDDIDDFSLNQAYIQMTLNKSYIGSINLLENGVPFNPF